MCLPENGRFFSVFSLVFVLWVAFFGCATSSQIKVLEEKTQQALEKSQEALKECNNAKAVVEDSSRYSAEAAASAQRAEGAAERAENAVRSATKGAATRCIVTPLGFSTGKRSAGV